MSALSFITMTRNILSRLAIKLSSTSNPLFASLSPIARFGFLLRYFFVKVCQTLSQIIPSFLSHWFAKAPGKMFLCATIAALCAKLASKFIWRARNNAKQYFAMEQAAYIRYVGFQLDHFILI